MVKNPKSKTMEDNKVRENLREKRQERIALIEQYQQGIRDLGDKPNSDEPLELRRRRIEDVRGRIEVIDEEIRELLRLVGAEKDYLVEKQKKEASSKKPGFKEYFVVFMAMAVVLLLALMVVRDYYRQYAFDGFNKYDTSQDPALVGFSPDEALLSRINAGNSYTENAYLTPVARCKIAGILAGKNFYYNSDEILNKALGLKDESAVVQVDVVVVWGDFSKPECLACIDSVQFGELRWSKSGGLEIKQDCRCSMDAGYVKTHQSHIHLVPADSNLLDGVKAAENGQKVYLEGYLVDIGNERGGDYSLETDLNFDGDGYQILYAEKIVVDGRIYQ
jgi:hypothetical protein